MDAVEEIKSRLSIEDVVSEYVQLKRTGRNFKGLSPWTNERTPSFIVSPEKQIWHDFSSGKGGDVISFVQAVEGLDFKGALEHLARKAGIELQQFSGDKKQPSSNKERLFDAVEQAVVFYQRQLLQHSSALKYVREQRQFSKQTILDFRFGYSPRDGNALTTHLTKKGFTIAELDKAGLIRTRGRDAYDMFRDRLMVPLLNPQGRPVGFTARLLSKNDNAPKYINTPSTPLYDKSRQLFGLSQAKEAIRKSGYVVVVEGNLDVVASHQAGVQQVVASAGTALTTPQLKSLQPFTGDVRLAFDEDRAGQAAVERAIPLAQAVGIELSVISLPAGKDPDELVRASPQAWQRATEQHTYMVDWLIERAASKVDMASAQGKRQFVGEVIALVQLLQDGVEREHYAKVLADRTGTSIQTIMEKLSKQPNTTKRLKRMKITQDAPDIREQLVREQHLLAMAIRSQAVGGLLHNVPLDVFSEKAEPVAADVQKSPGTSPLESDYGTILKLLFEEHYQRTDEQELVYQAKRLLTRLIADYAKAKKQELIVELESADDQTQKTLLQAVKHLDQLVTSFRSTD